MSFLLDTHVWLWSLVSPDRIPEDTRAMLENPAHRLLLSAASSWEIAIKYRLGELELPEPPHQFIPTRLVRDGVDPLSIEHHHAHAVAELPDHHKDPFDRLLIAQARMERLVLVTADQQFRRYDLELRVI